MDNDVLTIRVIAAENAPETKAKDTYNSDLSSGLLAEKVEAFGNVLVYGDVQSGKTGVIVQTIARLFNDSSCDLVFYLTGTKNSLRQQNHSRFHKFFSGTESFSTMSLSQESNLSPSSIESLLVKKKRLVITALKTNLRQKQILEIVTKISPAWKILIVDDEADETTTTESSQENFRSLASKRNIKFISITASPFANLEKMQDFYRAYLVLVPNKEYCGPEIFLNKFELADIVGEREKSWNKTVRNGFFYWSLITAKFKLTDSQLLINVINYNDIHENIYNFLVSIRRQIIDMPEEFFKLAEKIFPTLSEFSKKAFDIIKSLSGENYIVANGDSDLEKVKEVKSQGFEIVIGGLLLSRGITYENLTCEVMVNMGQKIKAGTLIQRARWCGYRGNKLEYMKIFSSTDVYKAYKEILDLISWTKKYKLQDANYSLFFKSKNYKYIEVA